MKGLRDLFRERWSVVAGDDLKTWRNRVSDSIFLFFTVFGFFAYIPALILSLAEGLWSVAIADTAIYLFCIAMTFSRRVTPKARAYAGVLLFYLLGVFILYILGPRGAGEVWLFAATVLAAFLLENPGAWIIFALNALTHVFFYIALRLDVVLWVGVEYQSWLIKAANFILLNVVIVLVSTIYQQGFSRLLAHRIRTRNATILGLAKLAEYRDNHTGDHLRRLQDYLLILGRELSRHPEYTGYITEDYLRDLRISSILHDIGKVGINDSILLKPGPLNEKEFEQIKEHSRIGYQVINEIDKNISSQSFYTIGKEIALHHHEKWDGSGYPDGCSGSRIPLSARLVALVDVYDALTSDRPYKNAFSHDEAVRIIRDGRGSHFDPDIVDAFDRVHPEFARMLEEFLLSSH